MMALLPQVADAVSVPVIAAGGIADGRGIAAALALGASGVQIGTAFLPCPSSAPASAPPRDRRGGDAATRLTAPIRPAGLGEAHRYVDAMAGPARCPQFR